MKRHTKAALIVVVGVMGVSLWKHYKEDYGVRVDSVWWLPSEAQNITYIRNDAIQIAEFDIERAAFEKWCARRKMPLRELRDEEEHTVDRCLLLLEQRRIIPTDSEPNDVEGGLRGMERASKGLDAGDLFYEERWSSGGGYSIGYDVEEERGYYAYAHH
ncbi:MAG: hypothetical protein RBS72_20410 [Sedimentisphaerales bacterium]|jgi:hypothetical protein|nr:hypothetical protein [Sedimentisphaerales bacterium]HNY80465.1 hypothetical protein [Sedimentisphaerales bacterium]HOC65306.1 hypothetical protein [Sedimentisphaerales bacterium]HOH66230.1 hypothetical protein [Sedimentisphaerales bacterium]HPY49315.1 hypothetical protein [Sedimentisphaerales bacterium]